MALLCSRPYCAQFHKPQAGRGRDWAAGTTCTAAHVLPGTSTCPRSRCSCVKGLRSAAAAAPARCAPPALQGPLAAAQAAFPAGVPPWRALGLAGMQGVCAFSAKLSTQVALRAGKNVCDCNSTYVSHTARARIQRTVASAFCGCMFAAPAQRPWRRALAPSQQAATRRLHCAGRAAQLPALVGRRAEGALLLETRAVLGWFAKEPGASERKKKQC